ncbi:TRAP transporter small permease [Coralliovum pocilloporae]|uniref:TRAP transporter small permease n=1 Tax=Coralliovum pocilloporae TaxID=3066369 RepID=UPI0033073D5A
MQRFGDLVTRFEETVIALLLAGMTLVTFSQVVARYVFNTGWGAALEFTTLMFAWMILFGMSYGLKIGAHLGVDAFIKLFPDRFYRIFTVLAALICLLYAALLLSADWLQVLFGQDINARGGAISYVQKMAKFGIGLEELRLPEWAVHAFGLESEEIPRWIAYLILPLGLALFAFRCIQAVWQIITGERSAIIAGHEAEELVAENEGVLKEKDPA